MFLYILYGDANRFSKSNSSSNKLVIVCFQLQILDLLSYNATRVVAA